MFKGNVRKFVGTPANPTLSGTFTQVYTAAQMETAQADGVLIYNGTGAALEVSDAGSGLPWYSIPSGSTYFYPLGWENQTGVFMKGSGTNYRSQMVVQ